MMLLARRLYQLALLVLIVALATGCGLLWGGPKSNTASDGNLGLRLWVSRSLPRVGEPVDIRFTVENFGDQIEIIQLEEKQEPVMDILIGFGTVDRTRLYWSDGREITPEMRRLELAPGESKTIEMTWVPDEKADHETVSVHGILNREQTSQHAPIMICVGECPIM